METLEAMNKDTTERRGRGRPKRDDSLVFDTIGLTPEQWERVRAWASENDTNQKTGKWNPSPALGRLVDDIERFYPNGPESGPPRGQGGRFLPRNGSTRSKRGKAKSELNAEIERLKAELAAALAPKKEAQ